MKQILAAALLLGAGPALADPNWTPPPAKDGHSYPPCYCTNREAKLPIGATACLQIGSRQVTARCGMSLNNPAWRIESEGCLGAGQPGASLQAPSDAGATMSVAAG